MVSVHRWDRSPGNVRMIRNPIGNGSHSTAILSILDHRSDLRPLSHCISPLHPLKTPRRETLPDGVVAMVSIGICQRNMGHLVSSVIIREAPALQIQSLFRASLARRCSWSHFECLSFGFWVVDWFKAAFVEQNDLCLLGVLEEQNVIPRPTPSAASDLDPANFAIKTPVYRTHFLIACKFEFNLRHPTHPSFRTIPAGIEPARPHSGHLARWRTLFLEFDWRACRGTLVKDFDRGNQEIAGSLVLATRLVTNALVG